MSLKRRIIACLDVIDGLVVKGVKFRDHEVLGSAVDFAKKYEEQGVDELVFYDIAASPRGTQADPNLVRQIAKVINIPFCVAGGIKSLESAEKMLSEGADKISINSPALENPSLIGQIAERFGSQCVVVGVDSRFDSEIGDFCVYQYTGDVSKTIKTRRVTLDWCQEVAKLGAGEIVLNCMDSDGTRIGYDVNQVNLIANSVSVPVVASGGAGKQLDFLDLFSKTKASGGLAASVFHKNIINIPDLKAFLIENNINIRL